MSIIRFSAAEYLTFITDAELEFCGIRLFEFL